MRYILSLCPASPLAVTQGFIFQPDRSRWWSSTVKNKRLAPLSALPSRRAFIGYCGTAVAALPVLEMAEAKEAAPTAGGSVRASEDKHVAGRSYRDEELSYVAFPLGGMGAGMFCLGGTGALTQFSLRNRPELHAQDVAVFAAISIKGNRRAARILEGPVPSWKFKGKEEIVNHWGLPRFHRAEFSAHFPFATVDLEDEDFPLVVKLQGWSPFEPGDADNASLPVAGLEYAFTNRTNRKVDAVFSFNAENFLAETGPWSIDGLANPVDYSQLTQARDRILPIRAGFNLYGPGAKDRPWDAGHCAVWTDDPQCQVDFLWSRLCSLQILWDRIETGEFELHSALFEEPSPGASIVVPFALSPGETKVITMRVAWHFPDSDLWKPTGGAGSLKLQPASRDRYHPWYSGKFATIGDVISYWDHNYNRLREASDRFSSALWSSTLPPEALETVAANLSILKSPAILRQTDGRLWSFEGCFDTEGAGDWGAGLVGSYGQAIAHLFPAIERGRREVEFGLLQNRQGLISIATPLPIRAIDASELGSLPIAPESQVGFIIKFYRDWRISGNTGWLRRWWSDIRRSLDYGIKTMDPDHLGWIAEPHGSNYDNVIWGPDSMCTSVYLAALNAAVAMGHALGEPVDEYRVLLRSGLRRLESELYNGEFFIHKVQWKGLRTRFPENGEESHMYYSPIPEGVEYGQKEGPIGGPGLGCFADGVYGAWLLLVAGSDGIFDADKIAAHLAAVHRYNFKPDLSTTANLGRAFFALGSEAGMVNCTWPRGRRPPIVIADYLEVWTGVEHEVASHLIAIGKVDEGMDIVRAVRHRYDGRTRNPFAEVEFGYWYVRALSSYALLQAFSGARFDAVDKVLYLKPAMSGDWRSFLSTETGYGTVGVRDGEPFVDVVFGNIPYMRIEYVPAAHSSAGSLVPGNVKINVPDTGQTCCDNPVLEQ
jgi:uncharacterized protein (DUF608 family)